MHIGIGIRIGGQGGGYAAETQALIARMSTPPTSARASLIDALIRKGKTDGWWTLLDVLYVFAAADSQAALLNWRSSSYTAAEVSSPTFVADRGYNGNGTTSYLTTGYDHTLLGQNDNYGAVWLPAAPGAPANRSAFGTWGYNINPVDGSGFIGSRSSAATVSAGTIASTGIGMTSFARNNSSTYDHRRNGVFLETITRTSQLVTTENMFVLGRNLSGVVQQPSAYRVAAVAWGDYLTPTQDAALYAALNTYLTAVGGAA